MVASKQTLVPLPVSASRSCDHHCRQQSPIRQVSFHHDLFYFFLPLSAPHFVAASPLSVCLITDRQFSPSTVDMTRRWRSYKSDSLLVWDVK